jgi:glycosyltransferase involved in cell wall biosynthesis
MRVGIDGTGWSNRRGHGRFTRNVVGRLVEAHGDATYVVYVAETSMRQLELPSSVEVRPVALSRGSVEADSRRGSCDLLRLSWAVSRDRPDVFLFPSLYTYFPVIGMPTVVGVHDTIAEDHPHLTLPTRRARAYWSAKRRLALRRATRLFTVSQAARTALVERFGLREDRVAVIPEAPAPPFRPRAGAEVETALAALGLRTRSYFLFAGGISPHKNLETLLDAYSKLREARDAVPPLVLVGDLDDDSYLSCADRVRRQIETLELGEHVRLPGFVADETLACLYSGATCVVLPSRAEGFGLPAVEAAACGAPLVLSDLPAHRETLDGAALFVRPTDVDGFAAALGRVLDDETERDRLAHKGQEAVAHLSWDAAADAVRRLLDEVVAGAGAHV